MAVDSKLLAQILYFSGMSPAELKAIEKYIAFEKSIEKGDTILSEGIQSDHVYFIINGVVKVFKRSPDGKEQILDIIYKGDSSGDVSLFDGSADQASMLAMTPVRLYAIKKSDLETIILEHPRVARNALKVMAGRIHRDTALVGELSFGKVINRLAKLIIKQNTQLPDMLPRLTQQDMAAMVGTSRAVVSRSLRIMEERGAIRLQRRRIVVLDEEALRDLAQTSS